MSRKILVGNVPVDVSEKSLSELFAQFGEVVAVEIPKTDRGRPKGFVFIEMSSRQEAVSAQRSLADAEFSGRRLTVTLNKVEPEPAVGKFSWFKLFGA